MPRKKNNKTGITAKQKKLLQTRLMRINIVIDEYVYKNAMISAAEAKAYIEEVAAYKSQKLDARSLQVIEKITRCMQTIVEEQEAHSEIVITDTQNDYTYCLSPVYSLPDEDKTMFSQNCSNKVSNRFSDEVYTIDLSDDEDNAVPNNMQVDVEIHRAMSSLSISENITHISEPYSQSILENFKPDAVNKPLNSSIDLTKSPKLILKLNTKDSTSDVLTNTKSITPQKLVIKNVNFNDDDIIFIEPTEPPISKRKRPIKKPNEIKKGTRQKKTLNKNTKRNVSNKGKKRNVENKKVLPITESIQLETHNMVNEKSNAWDKNSSSKMNLNANQINAKTNSFRTPANIIYPTKHKDYSKSTENIHNIYNKNIENDLSWIENIRFVREVADDEFDSKFSKIDDTFWNNLMFPNDWNDGDFNY